MTIKNFIEKAIAGGWTAWDTIRAPHASSEKFNVQRCGDCFCGAFTLHTHINLNERYYEILLDPLAWKAVGKVEGWNILEYSPWAVRDGDGDFVEEKVPEYVIHMHRMIDALAEGKTIEQFLATL